MQAQRDSYPWKRFWCPPDKLINISDGGYLIDPDSEVGKTLNPDVVSFDALKQHKCLVLLGEPGIGKTETLNLIRESLDREIEDAGDESAWFDLNSYSNEQTLLEKIFGAEEIRRWMKGNYQLHLFLDSLDECQVSIKTVSAILQRELKQLPLERLLLRIRCRTADWPKGLEQELRDAFGSDEVDILELVPLRRKDVESAASANDLDPAAFLTAVAAREVVPLAIKPVTLEFLIDCFRNDGSLPTTRRELYEKGCHLLCAESNVNRQDAGFTGRHSAEHRLAAASRIAALAIFGRYHAVTTREVVATPTPGVLSFTDSTGGTVRVGSDRIEVTKSLVCEVLKSGLFSGRSSETLGWAHQTYGEFLAARFLINQGLAVEQILGLIVPGDDTKGRVVPQLRETAAWLATMNDEIFEHILDCDAEVLLSSDVATAEDDDRKRLVEKLLSLYDSEEPLLINLGHYRHLHKLAHNDLDGQLLPYITNKAKGFVVRRAAIDIAEACEREALEHALTGVAMDDTDNYQVRQQAGSAVWRIASSATRARLKPLAIGRHDDDPDDELKGCALRATWPEHLTVDELFDNLTLPCCPNLYGAYKAFINELSSDLPPEAVPRGLKWIEDTERKRMDSDEFPRLRSAILQQAWEDLHYPGVLAAFAHAAVTLLGMHHSIFPSGERYDLGRNARIDATRRRQLLAAIVPRVDFKAKPSWWLATSGLLKREDVSWLFRQAVGASNQEEQNLWIELVDRFFWPDNSEAVELLLECAEICPPVAERFRIWIKPVPLKSEEAEQQRRRDEEHRKCLASQSERPLLDPPPSERIARLLAAFEGGELSAWWQINRQMTLEPDSTHYGDELKSDLTKLPGWINADSETKMWLIRAAEEYVSMAKPADQEWLGTNTLHRPAFAGYRALRLLQSESPDLFDALPVPAWKRWAATIVAYPAWSVGDDKVLHQQLVTLAYRASPLRVLEVLGDTVREEARKHDVVSITWKLELCWDDGVSQLLLAIAQEAETKPSSAGALVAELMRHNFDAAITWANSLITIPLPRDDASRERVASVACALLQERPAEGWDAIWPAMQADEAWGRAVVEKIAHGHREMGPKMGSQLTESQIGDLFIWLTERYPHADDLQHEGVHTVGPRESIAWFRDSVLGALKARGTRSACQSLERISQEFPGLEWLKWTIAEAWENTRRQTWQPLTPEAILKLAADQDARLVQSGSQLLTVVIESIKRLQEDLQGETPAAQFLWDEQAPKCWRPKSENRLSDYVKRYLDVDLRTRGVIANREVQIRSGTGGTKGENTDIHVDAISGNPSQPADRLTVIIETKGCWNQGLLTDMENQLAERYLKDNRCQHGLYLVGWYDCLQWDDEDSRKARCKKYELESLQKKLDDQAEALSAEGLSTDGKLIKSVVLNVSIR